MDSNEQISMEKLLDMEQELQRKMKELQETKRMFLEQEKARKLKEEMEKPIEVKVVAFSAPYFETNGGIRPDVLAVYKTIPSRSWNSYNQNNRFSVKDLNMLKEKLEQLPNVTFSFLEGVEEAIDNYVNAPSWEISLTEKYLIAKPGPQALQHRISSNVPGAEKKYDKNYFTIPLTEAYRLITALESESNVVWEEGAKEFVLKQLEQRALLDKIALMEDYDIQIPFANNHSPRNFQKVGIKFADLAGGRAIIADQMGLGKTPQALGYIAYKRKENPKFRALVICPASLKINWEREVLKFLGERPKVLSGSLPEKSDMIDMVTSNRAVTIINYDILGRRQEIKEETKDSLGHAHVKVEERFLWADLINLAQFDLIVADEAHYFKNKDANRTRAILNLQSPGFLELTGTPLLNRPGELWPLLNKVAPELFPSYERFIHQYTYDGKTARNVDELRGALKTIMIRRLKKDVVKDLPPINRIYDYTELDEKAAVLYEKVLEGVYQTIDTAGNEIQKNVTNILTQIMRLKQICAIDKTQKTADKAIELYDDSEGDDFRKVLIFSQFHSTTHKIKTLLGSEALGFVDKTPSGFSLKSLRERMNLVDEFQSNPKVHFLVATTKAAQEGLNITKAGHIIFNDLMWTPAAHDQAEGRAYGRLSECHSVDSYYMVCEKTIEEWIVDLLDAKLRMIEQIVEGTNEARDESIAMAIIERLREQMWTRKKK